MFGFTSALLLLSLNVVIVHGSGSPDTWKHVFPECGAINPNGHSIDQTEPADPGPLHDLTSDELRTVRTYLENHPKVKAAKPGKARLNSSYIYNVELMLPKKEEVLSYLDKGGPKPKREAHVIMFRGDLEKPVVQECVCGPLPNISRCELLNRPNRRNPVEWTVRPFDSLELKSLKEEVLRKVDEEAAEILLESYGSKFTGCQEKEDCLTASVAPVGTGVHKDMSKRLLWLTAAYNLKHRNLHPLDFAVLVNSNSTDSSEWKVEKAWYGETVFDSLGDLVSQYKNNSIPKTRTTKPSNDDKLFSNLHLRGDPMPPKPQRPPTLVEPDGKRYSVKEKKVDYLGWSFVYRLSSTSGPAVYDVRYKRERIVYEFAFSELASFFSGHAPPVQTLDNVGSSTMMGKRSKALIPGSDCPETATVLSAVFLDQDDEEPVSYDSAMCLFENNDGHAVGRHLAYSQAEGGFYGGVMDTQLTLRTAMVINGANVIVDFLFHSNGFMHARIKTTGYIIASFFAPSEQPYGHRVHDSIIGNLRQDMVSLKIDIDVNGQSNRYETLDIKQEKVNATGFPDKQYSQTRIDARLKTTEKDSVYDFDFSRPSYHIFHNNEKRNKYNEKRAFRIEVRDIAKNLFEKDVANEKSIPWARHQIVVTKRKEEEAFSSSIYANLDSQDPATDFSKYYEDNENIVDKDLVAWVTAGAHHILRSEDIPNAATIGNHMSVFLAPHNYHEESPSVSLRDAIYIEYKDPKDPSKGVRVNRAREQRTKRQGTVPGGRPSLTSNYLHVALRSFPGRIKSLANRIPWILPDTTLAPNHRAMSAIRIGKNGNTRDQCVIPKSTLEDDLEKKPSRILESRKSSPTED